MESYGSYLFSTVPAVLMDHRPIAPRPRLPSPGPQGSVRGCRAGRDRKHAVSLELEHAISTIGSISVVNLHLELKPSGHRLLSKAKEICTYIASDFQEEENIVPM